MELVATVESAPRIRICITDASFTARFVATEPESQGSDDGEEKDDDPYENNTCRDQRLCSYPIFESVGKTNDGSRYLVGGLVTR
jgi:hypothetical protein